MSSSHGPLACLGVGLAEGFSLIKSQHPYKRKRGTGSSTLCSESAPCSSTIPLEPQSDQSLLVLINSFDFQVSQMLIYVL